MALVLLSEEVSMGRSRLVLELLGGCLGVLTIALPARADIPITGGQVTGNGVFFVSSPPGPRGLFPITRSFYGPNQLLDFSIQSLRLETPNGVTTLGRFTLTRSLAVDSGYYTLPSQGHLYDLEGRLAGLAFTPSGVPVLFQNVPTTLNLTVNSFTAAYFVGGTLFAPAQAASEPVIFLPNVRVFSTSATSADMRYGLGGLYTGLLDAQITGGKIGLPADFQLRTPTMPPAALTLPVAQRPIQFSLSGTIPTPGNLSGGNYPYTDLDPANGDLALNNVQAQLSLRILDTAGKPTYQLDSPVEIRIYMNGTQTLNQTSTLDPAGGAVSFQVSGEGRGTVALLGNSTTYTYLYHPVRGGWFPATPLSDRAAALLATDSTTRFRFEQPSSGFVLEGRSQGATALNVDTPTQVIAYSTLNQMTVDRTIGDYTLNYRDARGLPDPNRGASFTPIARSGGGNPAILPNLNPADSTVSFATVAAKTTFLSPFNSEGGPGDPRSDQIREPGLETAQPVSQPDDAPIGVGKRRFALIGPPSRVFPGLVGVQEVTP